MRQEFEDAEVVDEDAQLPGLSKGSDMCGSGVPITCMHCCMYMEPPAEVGLETAKVTSGQRNRFSSAGGTSASSHDQFAELLEDYSYKWVLVCGDQQGRVFEFDLTQLLFHMRCLDKDARPNITTNPLAAYQQHAVFNFKEGLDEKRLRQIETLLARPIGAKCGSANLKMTEIIGFRGASISHISRRTLWYAYSGSGMAAICILQKCSNSSLCGPKASHGSGLILEPYAVITASDIGVVRMWSWQGQALGQLSEDELMTAEEYSKSILSKDLSTILQEGTVFLNSNSIEYMNASGAEKGLAVDLGNSILAAEQVPYKSGRQSSISQKESTRGGWVFPEWQICRPASADKLPTVTPFLQLPRSFAPRMDLLREWATPQVKVQIKALADANKIMNTFGHSIVADENSSFLELIHLQIDGAKSSFAAIVNAPLQHSLDIKPAIQVPRIISSDYVNSYLHLACVERTN